MNNIVLNDTKVGKWFNSNFHHGYQVTVKTSQLWAKKMNLKDEKEKKVEMIMRKAIRVNTKIKHDFWKSSMIFISHFINIK